MPRRTIDVDRDLDRWRYRCPLNHARWAVRAHDEIYCRTCRNSVGLSREECHYDVLVDKRTNERIPVAQIEIEADEREDLVAAEVSRA